MTPRIELALTETEVSNGIRKEDRATPHSALCKPRNENISSTTAAKCKLFGFVLKVFQLTIYKFYVFTQTDVTPPLVYVCVTKRSLLKSKYGRRGNL
jgi:hypothetical protein